MWIWPAATSHHGGDGFFNLALVGIAASNEAERQSVRAENEMYFAAIGKTRERHFDLVNNRLDILRMQMEFLDDDFARG
jgi:hypothetical protein